MIRYLRPHWPLSAWTARRNNADEQTNRGGNGKGERTRPFHDAPPKPYTLLMGMGLLGTILRKKGWLTEEQEKSTMDKMGVDKK